MNRLSLKILGFCVLSLVFAGCGKKNPFSGGNDSPPATPKTSVVSTEEVTNGNCLNLQKLFQRMTDFPPSTLARRFTTDVKVSSNGAQGILVSTAYRRAFNFEEKPFAEIIREFSHIDQNECKTVAFIDEFEERDEFEVEPDKSAADTLSLKHPDGRHRIYQLLSTQSMRETLDYSTPDRCDEKASLKFSQVRMYKWGEGEVPQRQTEAISSEFLRHITEVITAIPDELRRNTDSSNEVSVSVGTLRQLASSEIRIDYDHGCPGFGPVITPPQPLQPATPGAGSTPRPHDDGGGHRATPNDPVRGEGAGNAGPGAGSGTVTNPRPRPSP